MTHLAAFLLGLLARDLYERWRRWETRGPTLERGVELEAIWPPDPRALGLLDKTMLRRRDGG